MSQACTYILTGRCSTSAGWEERDYVGVFRVKANQTRESARSCREMNHVGKPVKWMQQSDPDSLEMKVVGHTMTVQEALVQEAILTASRYTSGTVPVRGGPWAHPHIGVAGRQEIKAVNRISARAENPAAARRAVLEYATSLSETSYLHMHCWNKPFRSDTAEALMSARGGARRRRTSGPSQSGARKRHRWGLTPGSDEFMRHKFGADVALNRANDLAKRSRANS